MKENMVIVAMDTRDSSKDRLIDREVAHRLYNEEKLGVDIGSVTNTQVKYAPMPGHEAEVMRLSKQR